MTVATGLTVLDYGDQALLLDFDSTAEVLAWVDALPDADLLEVDPVLAWVDALPDADLLEVDPVPAWGVVAAHTGTPWRPPALLAARTVLQFSEVRR